MMRLETLNRLLCWNPIVLQVVKPMMRLKTRFD